MEAYKMVKDTREWDDRYHSDGTRRGDNAILQQIDRATGSAGDRKSEREQLSRTENSGSGRSEWMKPFAKVDVFGKPTVFAGPGRRR